MYGEGLIYIKNIDIWQGKLRLTMLDTIKDTEMYIFMTRHEARDLAIDIMKIALEIQKE